MSLANGRARAPAAACRLRAGAGVLPMAAVLVALVLLAWICLFQGIERLYPIDKTEALQLALADSIAMHGDWVTPTIDGRPYFDKPPLPYWIGAWLLHLAPHAVWLPRVAAAVTGCLGMAATAGLAYWGPDHEAEMETSRSMSSLGFGVTAASILALTPAYFLFSRVAVHDIYLTVSIAVVLALVFLLSRASAVSTRIQILSGGLIGLALGVGVLAKGLLSLALPVLVAGLYLAVADRSARRPFTGRFGLALLLGLALVTLPWHLAAWQAHGHLFVEKYLMRSHVRRFATELDHHTGPWFFYLLAYPALTFPWGIPAAVAWIERHGSNPRLWLRRARHEPLLLFCAIWIVVTVGLLSLASTKLPHYILSALPPTAILAASYFWPSRQAPSAGAGLSRLLLLLTSGVLLLAALLLRWSPALLIPVSQKTPDFSLALRAQLGGGSTLAGLSLLAAAALWAVWCSQHHRASLAALWMVCTLCFLLFQAPPLMQAYRHTIQDPRLALAQRALQERRTDEPLQVFGQAWYSIKILSHGRAEILSRGKAFGEAHQVAVARACGRPGLLLGPVRSIETLIKSCGSGSAAVLHQDRRARLILVRWQPFPASKS